MRDLIVRLALTDEEATAYEGRCAMMVSVSDAEVAELRDGIVGCDELLAAMAAELPQDDASPLAVAVRKVARRMGRVRE